MDHQELTPSQAEVIRLRCVVVPSDELYALVRAFREVRDGLTRGDASEAAWWTAERLNHAAVIASQVLRDRDLMAMRMADAAVEAAGVQALGPPERPGEDDADYA